MIKTKQIDESRNLNLDELIFTTTTEAEMTMKVTDANLPCLQTKHKIYGPEFVC